MKKLTLSPMLARHRGNNQTAAPGEASVAVNLRQYGRSLVVVGQPTQVATIPAGYRLLLALDGQYFTLQDHTLYCDGNPITAIDGDVVGMHRVGSTLVVVTQAGLVHLGLDASNHWTVVSTTDAVPSITLSATSTMTVEQSLDTITLQNPLDTWRAPLSTADVATLTTRYRTAWNAAVAAITAQGAYCAPIQATYGVRLWDDTYLYIAEPVTLGNDTLANANEVSATATVSSGRYTGIEAAVLAMRGYHLGIEVKSGVGEQWTSMIKAIDIFATAPAAIAHTQSLHYRCSTTSAGSRQATLQWGWQAVPAAQVAASLQASGFNLVASTTDIDALGNGRFLAPNVSYAPTGNVASLTMPLEGGEALSRQRVIDINQGSHGIAPVASLVRNGRLYIASAQGQLACSAHGNALVTTQLTQVTGARVLAIAPVSRPIYSGGFGRYAVYIFTLDGIYAVAQSAVGTLGEARLVDRSVIAQGCVPVDGHGDVYYVDRYGWLCRLTGSTVTRLVPGLDDAGAMAWDDAHSELHIIVPDGMLAVTRDGFYSRRTVAATALHHDILHALAVAPDGRVLDLTTEQPASMLVTYKTCPADMTEPTMPAYVVWWVDAQEATLEMSLVGMRGMREFELAGLHVDGDLLAPLPMRVVAPLVRALVGCITGKAATGTVINATTITLEPW